MPQVLTKKETFTGVTFHVLNSRTGVYTQVAASTRAECKDIGAGVFRLMSRVNWFENPAPYQNNTVFVAVANDGKRTLNPLQLAAYTPWAGSGVPTDTTFSDWPSAKRIESEPIPDSGYWSISNYVGQGFNVYGAYDMTSATGLLFNYPDNAGHSFSLQGKTLQIPSALVGVDDASTNIVHASGSTRESYQDSLAASANVQVGIGAFSGDVDVSFSIAQSSASDFAFNKFTFVSQLGHLELRVDPANLNDSLKESIAALPDRVDPDNLQPFAAFFQRHGVFFVWRVVFGGSLDMYTAVANTSGLSTADIEVEVEASYGALFKTGAKVAASSKRESFKENASTSVRARGGDLTLAAKLALVDAESASPDTVTLFTDWVESVKLSPAPVNFSLKGLWELCGSKRGAVQTAWNLYAQVMHPKLAIQSYSLGNANLPVVTLGRQLKPVGDPPAHPYGGWQIIILDRSNLLSDAGVKFDRYYPLPCKFGPNGVTYGSGAQIVAAYDAMYADIMGSGFATDAHLLVAISYGLIKNFGPSGNFFGLLHACGGSTRNLDLIADVDHNGSGNHAWTDYILVGAFESGSGAGVEYVRSNPSGDPPTPTSQPKLDVLFYRDGVDERYAFSSTS